MVRLSSAGLLAALGLTLAGCQVVEYALSHWDLVSVEVTGPTETRPGEPVGLGIAVDLVPAIDPTADERRRDILEDPSTWTWSVQPTDGSQVVVDGVFSTTSPGTYTVTAAAFGLADEHVIVVSPSFAGTYSGTFLLTATDKRGRSATVEVPITLAVEPEGSAVLTARYEGKTTAGRLYVDATASGRVDEAGSLAADGTMSQGPSEAKARGGPIHFAGALDGETVSGFLDLPNGAQADIRMTLQ
jgi:hypothetical protein